MTLPTIDTNRFTTFLVDLLNIPSPTGFAESAIEMEKGLSKYKQLQLSRTRKGALIAKWEVKSNLPPVALTAHVDTLGAVQHRDRRHLGFYVQGIYNENN